MTTKKEKRYNPAKFNPVKGGHAPGHLREFFKEIAELLNAGKAKMTTKLSDRQNEDPYTVGEVIGLLWKCTDQLPGSVYDTLVAAGLDFQKRTYAAAARASKRLIEEKYGRPTPKGILKLRGTWRPGKTKKKAKK